MAEEFLNLPAGERLQILRAKAREIGLSETVLEKDVWVCWALQKLFSLPGMPRMAFKGGTSLSKVFGAIKRFSEDIDITFDFRDLRGGLGFDDDPEKMSKARLKRFREALEGATCKLIQDRVAPALTKAIREISDDTADLPQADALEGKITVFYPRLSKDDNYSKEGVVLEFGGRNITEPCSRRRIAPDIAKSLPDLLFPIADVAVLAPERTFWEKATLIHAKCLRGDLGAAAARPSRHWYDLAVLADHEIGRRALADRALFSAVVKHKTWAFKDPKAQYERCLEGGLSLIPMDEPSKQILREDFSSMVSARYFFSTPPTFDEIVERLDRLAGEINASAR